MENKTDNMRQIKFRGKDPRNNKWVYGYFSTIENREHYILSPCGLGLLHTEVIPESVGMYWRTVNNQELFEGDIFSVNGKYNKVVRWVDKHAAFCVANIDELNCDWMDIWQRPDPSWFKDFGREIVIIGNEFDNPELLKV